MELEFIDPKARSYSSPAVLQKKVEEALADYIAQGYMFNILCVERVDVGITRYVPLLNCWRNSKVSQTELTQVRLAAARMGFYSFA